MQWLAADGWFSPGNLVSSTNKADRHDSWNIVESGFKQIWANTSFELQSKTPEVNVNCCLPQKYMQWSDISKSTSPVSSNTHIIPWTRLDMHDNFYKTPMSPFFITEIPVMYKTLTSPFFITEIPVMVSHIKEHQSSF